MSGGRWHRHQGWHGIDHEHSRRLLLLFGRQLSPRLAEKTEQSTGLPDGTQPQSQVVISYGPGLNVFSEGQLLLNLLDEALRSRLLLILIRPLQRIWKVVRLMPVKGRSRQAVVFRYRPETLAVDQRSVDALKGGMRAHSALSGHGSQVYQPNGTSEKNAVLLRNGDTCHVFQTRFPQDLNKELSPSGRHALAVPQATRKAVAVGPCSGVCWEKVNRWQAPLKGVGSTLQRLITTTYEGGCNGCTECIPPLDSTDSEGCVDSLSTLSPAGDGRF